MKLYSGTIILFKQRVQANLPLPSAAWKSVVENKINGGLVELIHLCPVSESETYWENVQIYPQQGKFRNGGWKSLSTLSMLCLLIFQDSANLQPINAYL